MIDLTGAHFCDPDTCSLDSSWPFATSNDTGGIVGRLLELVVRDTAADPQRAAAAVNELARLGVAALAGEYHSVVARAAAARADALGLPFLCSSAVLDALTDEPTEWVARLAPAQSHGRPRTKETAAPTSSARVLPQIRGAWSFRGPKSHADSLRWHGDL